MNHVIAALIVKPDKETNTVQSTTQKDSSKTSKLLFENRQQHDNQEQEPFGDFNKEDSTYAISKTLHIRKNRLFTECKSYTRPIMLVNRRFKMK